MADRRSAATKSAGQAPSTTQTSKAKAAAAVATQQANKGLSQKQLAEKYGGKYQEGDKIVQVGSPVPGRALSIELSERLSFSDKVASVTQQQAVISERREERSKQIQTEEQRIIKSKEEGLTTRVFKTPTKEAEGKKLSITLNESLGFGDREQSPGPAQPGVIAPYGPGFIIGASYLAGGGAEVFAKKGKIKESIEPFDVGKSINNEINVWRERFIGLGESAKNLGITILEENLKSFDPTVIRTLGSRTIEGEKKENVGYIVDPKTKEYYKKLESEKIPGTAQEKYFTDPGSIDLTDPRTQGQLSLDVITVAGPGGGTKAVIKGAEIVAVQAEKSAVKSLSNYLKSIGDTFGLERIGGTKEVTSIRTLIPKEGGAGIDFKIRKTVKVPSKGKGTYISTGGTEEATQPIRVLKAGQREIGFQKEVIKNPVTEITPTGERPPTITPSKADIRGFLSKTDIKDLGVKQQAGQEGLVKNLYTNPKMSPRNRQKYLEGLEQKQIKEIAKTVTAPLKNVLSGKGIRDYFNSGSKRIQGVFAETKAEKLEPITRSLRPGQGPKTPYPKYGPELPTKGPAGGAGKEKGFSGQQYETIKASETAKVIQQQAKQDMDILFKGPRNLPGGFISAYQTYQEPKQKITHEQESKQIEKYPTQQKNELQGGIQDLINAKVITPQKSKNEGVLRFTDFISTKLTPGGKQKEEGLGGTLQITDFIDIVKQTPRQPLKEKFWLVDDLSYKLTPGIPDTPPPPPPPPTIPVLIPKQEPIFFPPYIPALSLGSGGYGQAESAKRVYAAYGISSDINIKTLPTFSRYGSSSKIFKAQEKEDKRIQKLFYGKPKTKSKKSKSKRKGKRR